MLSVRVQWLALSSLVAIALFAIAKAYAATRVLTISATGTILPMPDWQNGSNASISTMSFNFGTLFAGPTAAANVDSANFTAKLVNASSYPATVALVRPSGCTIGATPVLAANVHFMNNRTAVTANGNITITSNANQTYALRFASAGNHGTNSGAVSCTTSGNLTYTY